MAALKPTRAFLAKCLTLIILCGGLNLPGYLKATGEQHRPSAPEYGVKAAFLLNFAKFVEWPPPDDVRTQPPFSICILGSDPYGAGFDQLVEGETINGRSLTVKRIAKWRSDCQVLFIPASERNIAATLGQVGPGVLTVGESPEFLREGGMINFVLEDRRVKFDINREAAERASLRISSRLLAVARSVVK